MVAIVGIVLSSICWFEWHSALITDDGVQYLSTAENWLQGNGLSTNALIYEPHFQGRFPAPQTVWVPGFPFLIALAGSIGFELVTAALLLNLTLNGASALFFYLILKRCGIEPTFAIVSASLFYFTAFPWYFAVAIMSEPLFTCLVLAAVYFLPCTSNPKMHNWIMSGVLLGACIATRYSGVFVAASVGSGLFCLFVYQTRLHHQQKFVHKLTGLLFCLLFPLAIFGFFLVRTRLVSGSVERRTGVIEAKSIYETLWQYFEQASVLAGFKDGLLFTGELDTWMFLFFMLVCLCIVLMALALSKQVFSRATMESATTFTTTTVVVLLFHTFMFSAYLIYASVTDTPLSITYRYLYQIYPGLFLIFCLIIAAVVENNISKKALSKFRLLVGIAIITFGLAQINMIFGIKDFYRRGVDSKELVNLQILNGSTVGEVVGSCVGAPVSEKSVNQASLWSNEGVLLQINTGVNTISFPSTYASVNVDFEHFQADIDTYRIRMFVFIKTQDNMKGKYGAILSEIEQWLNDRKYSKLQLEDSRLQSGASVDIYIIDNDCYL